jgi:thiamine-monophosphate kinase
VLDPDTKVGQLGEKGLVRHIRSRIPAGPGVVVGVGDDAAAVETGSLTLVTTDSLVEGVHFRREWSPPRLLGRKALTVNLSDVAAMAGIPRHATISLCLPPDVTLRFVDGLYDGLLERAAESGVNLVGGNVSSSWAEIVIDVTLLGQGDRLLLRSGAVAGDLAVVTGRLGAAAAGLRLLSQGARLDGDGLLTTTGVWTSSSSEAVSRCLKAFLDPAPPLAFARALAEQDIVHAAMDLSDGLSGDLLEMCQASDASAWVDPSAVPIDPQAAGLQRAQGGDVLSMALHGGEDYQFLLAVPPGRLEAVKDLAIVWDMPLTVVGEFGEGPPALALKAPGGLLPLTPQSHDHFRRRPGSRTEAKRDE